MFQGTEFLRVIVLLGENHEIMTCLLLAFELNNVSSRNAQFYYINAIENPWL